MTFKKIESKDLKDIQSIGHLYTHEETGAKVLYLENDDSNKAFTIAFKTPPYNDNGITHILEHSVLNGSKKYPSKEPFVELIKGSLNTFVNAMTFSDKTIYPVASTNQKDFRHLMGVYLDAVFQPAFINNPQILAQEGWHYHLEDAEDELIYKGVVYNEMKGATASPERQLHQAVTAHLYPDSIYEYESGGDPKAIPSLTQEEFVDYHESYYHPSNSMTILYGDLDLDKAFADLEEYFSGKGKLEETVDLSLTAEKSDNTYFEESYSITEGDDPKDKDFLALAWHTALPKDTLDGFGLSVLEEILLGNNQSPLKKALLDAEIGGDISGGTADIGYPRAFILSAKYSDIDKMEAFKKVVKETLENLVNEGIDQELIQSALNKITFETKEMAISEDNPRGVLFAITALSSWLYDADPFINLDFSKYLNELAEKKDEAYFEKLIQEKLLDNPIFVEVALKADPGKNDRLEQKVKEELRDYKESLSDQEVHNIVDKTQALIERQNTPDSEEDLAKIPTLQREDLSSDVEKYPLEINSLYEFKEDKTEFYHAEQFTAGIDYLDFYFDLKDIPQKEYSLLSYLSKVLTHLETKNYDVSKLQNEINTHTGGIHGKLAIFEGKEGIIEPYFVLSAKALEGSFDQLIKLVKEIMINTQFTDLAEISKLTQVQISNFEAAINNRSHVLAANRALSQVKASSKLAEISSGIDYFNYLKIMNDELKENKENHSISEQLAKMLEKLLNKKRLNVLYTGPKERASIVKEKIKEAFDELTSESIGQRAKLTTGPKQNEAYITAQDVNYVGLGTNSRDILPFNGMTNVLSSAIRFDYLWNEIRVKGGAYGSLFQHRRKGQLALASYRDPNIKETLAVYKKLPNYLETLELSQQELTKYIIGSISPLEQPKSARSKGVAALSRLKNDFPREDIIQLKEEILAVDPNEFKKLADSFDEAINDASLVVIGNKAKIEEEKELFDEINTLY